MHGKAHDVISALPFADSLEYEKLKIALLQAYKLVLKAYF